MRILLDEATLQRVLRKEQTAFVRRVENGDLAEARSFGHGVKEYLKVNWHMDTGWGNLEKGKSYSITTGVDQSDQGEIFIQGLDKDDWLPDRIIKRLGFSGESDASRKAQFVQWWNTEYPDTPWNDNEHYWYVHFALRTNSEQAIPTDEVVVKQIVIDPNNLEGLDILDLLGLKPKPDESQPPADLPTS